MNEYLAAIKAAIGIAITAITAFLGWKGVLAVVWVVAMALDYVSGSVAACKEGEWASGVARQGLWHKGGMILVVAVAGLADLGLDVICANLDVGFAWPGLALPLVLAWYLITELGSILENAVKMGVSVPNWLTKVLKASLTTVDQMGGNTGEEREE